MPTSPADWEDAALELRRIYANAERIMLQRVAQSIAEGIESDGWEQAKLAEIQRVRRDIEREASKLEKEAMQQVSKAVWEAYQGGSAEAVADLKSVIDRPLVTSFHVTHRRAVERIVGESTRKLMGTHFRILRVAEDMYRSVVAEAASYSLTGVMTRREAAQVALNVWADQGITGFVDAAGRNWDIASYAEMATRTASGRAAVEGHLDRLRENNYDLVIVSHSPSPCEKCDPWEGRILSLGGEYAGRYPTVDEAHADGLQHPNCTHSISAFIPGLTEPPERRPKELREASYEARQRQREIERNIRKYKRREAVALTMDARMQAQQMVTKWEMELERHLARSGREHKRRRERESITGAR